MSKETIISGYALTRQVYVDKSNLEEGIRLAITPSPYDWGYNGEKPRVLALDVLKRFLGVEFDKLTPQQVDLAANTILECIVKVLPKGNFEVKVKLSLLIDICLGKQKFEGLIHAHQFMKVKHDGNFIPLYVSFMDLPYASWKLHEDTLEFKYLKSMGYKDLKKYELYLRTKSTRKALRTDESDSENTPATTFITINALEENGVELFEVKNGYGTGEYMGTKSDYESI